jgi:hypothetical protein
MAPALLLAVMLAVPAVATASATSPSRATDADAVRGRVVISCTGTARFGPPGPVHGYCTIRGAIVDRGRFADDSLRNPHDRVIAARKGTIRLSVYNERGNWEVNDGTRAYEGLLGRGWEANSGRCRRPGCRISITMHGRVWR